jgi:NTP pyrophosphatase (non-canonical NTP hydrolase)
MKLNDFQEISKRTMPNKDIKKDSANYAMGLAGEAGEVTDLLKKWVFHGHALDRMELKKELGDVLHYLSGLCTLHHFTLEEVATANIEKLMKRFPNGFSTEASIKRVDENEQR